MVQNKKNYEELSSFLPQNGNAENYAFLTHFLQMPDGKEKDAKSRELMKTFGFEAEKLSEAQSFWKRKKIRFKSEEKPKFTFIDLFAGIGGFRLAMQECGGECVFSSEWDDAAKQTYYENYGEVPFGDITKEETKSLIPDHFDVLCAGFPCQPFSMMGQQKGFNDTRGTLFFDIAEIIKVKKPKAIVLENVRSLKTHDKGRTFQTILRVLEQELGYKVFFDVLNTSDYGIPQTRNRTYIICFKDSKNSFSFPAKVTLKQTLQDLLEENVEQKYFLSEKILPTILSNGTGNYRAKSEIDLKIARPLCATMAKMHRACQDNYVTQKGRVRRLTPRECARLQGFSDKFKISVSDSQAYKQFGNAVSVCVSSAVAKSVVKHLREES